MRQLTCCFVLFCVAGASACSSTDTPTKAGTDAGAPASLALAVECTDALDAVDALPDGLPSFDASHRGDVVRCAVERALSTDELSAALHAQNVVDVDVKSAVRVYRVAYRTERLLGKEGFTTARLFLPDRPIAARAPVVVAAHGFIGLTDDCRFSRQIPLTGSHEPEMSMMLALASYGYPVIAPDYPGRTADAKTMLFSSEDEGHSVLDGTRAMQHLVAPGGTSDQVVLVGHSQGGHAVLSARALAASYGLAGHLVAVVPFAPLWLVGRVWGAVVSNAAGFTTAHDPLLLSLAMLYFNTHAEALDGPGSGLHPKCQRRVRQLPLET